MNPTLRWRSPLASAVLLLAQTSVACSSEPLDDANPGSSELVGDWMAIRSESQNYTGSLGDGLVYFMFLNASTLCIATCNPLPSDFVSPCTSTYACQCRPYKLHDGVLSGGDAPILISFEDETDVFVGQTTLSGLAVKNWYRRVNSLPAEALQCRSSTP